MSNPQPRLVDLLAIALRATTADLTRELQAEGGISLDHWRALRLLDERAELTMGELAERLYLPAATTTRVVDGLVDRALAYRGSSDRDRRVVVVVRSAAGGELCQRLEQVVARSERLILAPQGAVSQRLFDDLQAFSDGVRRPRGGGLIPR